MKNKFPCKEIKGGFPWGPIADKKSLFWASFDSLNRLFLHNNWQP